jgi:predicted TIM-barrel enzyme
MRFDRTKLLASFRDKIARNEPIIGGGAGTGLSAKCEEAGGIDLIVIYNSGRYRMAGRGSLAGLLAYGDANQIVVEMAAEVLPVVRHTPVLAGVNGTDPFRVMDVFLDELKRIGFAGVQNFPTVGLIDGTFRANLEETGMSYGLEVDMIALAREKDMLTTPYVFSSADATAMAKAGADIIVCHLGLTTGGSIGADTAPKLEHCPAKVDEWRAGRNARGRPLRARQHEALPRILRRLLDGAPARRDRADRTDEGVQGDQTEMKTRRNTAQAAGKGGRTCLGS